MSAVLSLASVAAWARPPSAAPNKPLLLFEIDEGFRDGLLGQFRDHPDGIVQPLARIQKALAPLAAKYEVAVLVYPSQAYSEDANGKGRAEPVLNRMLSFFDRTSPRIGVFLEAYSSGVSTQQRASSEARPTPYLGTTVPDRRRPGFSMDLRTFATLADAYPKTFRGIRFHEVYGSDIVWKVSAENQKVGFPFDEEVVRGCLDLCARKGLRLLWSDSNWLMKSPPTTGEPHYVYNSVHRPYYDAEPYRSIQDEAVAKLGKKLCFSWANNNYHFTPNLEFLDSKAGPSAPGTTRPLPEWLYFDMPFADFPLKGKGESQWGMSIQSWFWHELSYTLTGRYYHLGELACPFEVMGAYVKKGLREGASILQFEPGSYFFNEWVPGSPENTASYERVADHSGRLALRRLERILLSSDPAGIPDRLDAIFDRNQQRFLENDLAHPPTNYAQTTLVGIDRLGLRSCYDRYSYDRGWRRDDSNRFGSWVFDSAKTPAYRCEIDGDGVDELLVVRKDPLGRARFGFLNQQSCTLAIDTSRVGEEGSELVGLTAANLVHEIVQGGDPDELVLAWRPRGSRSVRLEVVKVAPSGVSYPRLRLVPLAAEDGVALLPRLSAWDRAAFVGLVALRKDARIDRTGARSLDRLLVVCRSRTNLEVRTLNGADLAVPLDIPGNASDVSCCPLDDRLTGSDSLLLAWTTAKAKATTRRSALYRLSATGFDRAESPVPAAVTAVVALRKRILLNGDSDR